MVVRLECLPSDAGWSSLVARRAHNPKVVGSNPAPATKQYKHISVFICGIVPGTVPFLFLHLSELHFILLCFVRIHIAAPGRLSG